MAKRIMRSFRMNEISAVDRPAQAHAKAVIMKRAPDAGDDYAKSMTAQERHDLAARGLAKPDGSYPIRHKGDLENAIRAWGRGGATASDKEWIMRRAKALGATDMLPPNWVSKTAGNGNHLEVTDMTEDDVKKMIAEAVKTETADLSKQLEAANAALAKAVPKKPKPNGTIDDPEDLLDGGADEMTEDQKGRAKKYADARVTKAIADTKDEIAKVNAEDEVIKVGDVEFKKSQTDPQTFAVIKAQQADIAKERDARELADLSKRAETEFGNLPGETIAKAKALRAMAKMGEDEREAIEAMLKSGHNAMQMQMQELGHQRPSAGSAQAELDAKAGEYAKEHKVSVAEAVSQVLDTAEGAAIYKRVQDEKRAGAN